MMKALEKIISKGEGKTVEFKETLPHGNGLAKTIIAFSNMAGGKIFIGVRDKTGGIQGISEQDILNFPDRIANLICDSCSPTIIPEIYLVKLSQKPVLVVEVYPGSSKPYFLRKKGRQQGTYVRIGATNKVADKEMLRELDRQARNISIDEEIAHDKEEKDIHFDRIRSDFEKYTERRLRKSDLLTLKMLKKESGNLYPTIGGLLISGAESDFEHSRIRCARFKGNNVSEFIDQKEFTGSLYRQVEEAINFAKIHISKSGKITELQRVDRYEVPIEAIREAVVNAVVHRDYSLAGSDIKLAIFDDRIEITSPGALPKALEIEDILLGRSEIRNRVIARFFKEIRFIEQWGTGITRMILACKNAGLREPEFKESGLFFQVIIYKGSRKSSQKVSGKGSQKDSQKSSQKIFEAMKANPSITIYELSEMLGISDRAVKNNINKLKNEGMVKRIGPDKGGYWEVK